MSNSSSTGVPGVVVVVVEVVVVGLLVKMVLKWFQSNLDLGADEIEIDFVSFTREEVRLRLDKRDPKIGYDSEYLIDGLGVNELTGFLIEFSPVWTEHYNYKLKFK